MYSGERAMFRSIAGVSMVMIVFGAASAFAQEAAPGPGRVEVTYTPVGVAYVASKNDAPSFGNYGFGTSATFKVNRVVGIEGEVGAMIATNSDLQFGDLDS